jgi:hypothetical protein
MEARKHRQYSTRTGSGRTDLGSVYTVPGHWPGRWWARRDPSRRQAQHRPKPTCKNQSRIRSEATPSAPTAPRIRSKRPRGCWINPSRDSADRSGIERKTQFLPGSCSPGAEGEVERKARSRRQRWWGRREKGGERSERGTRAWLEDERETSGRPRGAVAQPDRDPYLLARIVKRV